MKKILLISKKKYKILTKLIFKYIFFVFFCSLDIFVFITINILTSKKVFELTKIRPWRFLKLNLNIEKKTLWKRRIAKIIRLRESNKFLGSTCLSISISGRIILDIIGVKNYIHLSMNKINGRKIPHAWLSDRDSGFNYSSGLRNYECAFFIKI